jgi:hypothetical protein
VAVNNLLGPILREVESPFIAVLDGAQFDDLPAMLVDGNFVHRSLYRDDGSLSIDAEKTAPRMVRLDRDRQDASGDDFTHSGPIHDRLLERLFDLVGGRPAAVFWACSKGADVLYRHLRTINVVMFPDMSAPLANRALVDAGSGHERVLFRHSDANVMAQVMPSLTPANVARVLGPSEQIVFVPDDDWNERPMTARRTDGLPQAPAGFLRLSRTEAEAIEQRQTLRSQRRIVRYLRDVAPNYAARMDGVELNDFVEKEIGKAKAFGVCREDMIGRWTFMQLTSGADLSKDRHVRRAMTDQSLSETPDERVQILFDLRLQLLKERA